MQSNEYIKKQAVYEILDRMKRIRDRDTAGLISDAVSASIRCVEGNVMVARAEDVAPVRHGRWEWDGGEDMHYYCSRCHHNAYGCTAEILDGIYRYCPNCGALMDKDGDGDV